MNMSGVSFKGSYVVPYEQLKTMDNAKKTEYAKESTEFLMKNGGKIEQTKDGVKDTVPMEKEQAYLAMLAKYNIISQKVADETKAATKTVTAEKSAPQTPTPTPPAAQPAPQDTTKTPEKTAA